VTDYYRRRLALIAGDLITSYNISELDDFARGAGVREDFWLSIITCFGKKSAV